MAFNIIFGILALLFILWVGVIVLSVLRDSSGETDKQKVKRLRKELEIEKRASVNVVANLRSEIRRLEFENDALRLGFPMPTVSAYEKQLAAKLDELEKDNAKRLVQIEQAYERNNTRGTKK